MKKRRGRPSASVMAGSLVFMPSFVRPIRRCLWSSGHYFRPQAGRRAVCLQLGRMDYHCIRNGCLSGQAIHYPGADTLIALPYPTDLGGLRRAVFLQRIAPAQAIAINGYYTV